MSIYLDKIAVCGVLVERYLFEDMGYDFRNKEENLVSTNQLKGQHMGIFPELELAKQEVIKWHDEHVSGGEWKFISIDDKLWYEYKGNLVPDTLLIGVKRQTTYHKYVSLYFFRNVLLYDFVPKTAP